MLDRNAVYEDVKEILFAHATKNARGIYRHFIDGAPVGQNMLGSSVDAKPFEGKVIAVTDQVVIVTPKRNTFEIIEKSLMAHVPQVGDKVEVIPYFRKEFDGQRLGSPVKADTQFMDGILLYKNSCLLGGEEVRIPGEEVKNSELRALVCQLQQLKLSDGYRKITNLLVDVGANNFRVVDPVSTCEEQLPSIKFDVPGPKFKGDVEIVYHYGRDTYSINFYADEVKKFDDVHFDELAGVLEDELDDGLWQQIKVNVISKAKPARKAA